MEKDERHELARKRWRLLIEVLTRQRARIDDTESFSVRRFNTFDLLKTTFLETEEPGHTWYEYTCSVDKKYTPLVRHLDTSVKVEDILGFNNTGNVCVWPSEEVLTYYCLKKPEIFRDKVVCEIGGGMTCLSGLAVAMCTEAKEVLLTDGNERSMQNADAIISRNKAKFEQTSVKSRVLRWDEYKKHTDLESAFDTVICADCLFFDEYRQDLVNTLNYIVKPKGVVISLAPTRGKSFQQFVHLAKEYFDAECTENYDGDVWDLHQENLGKGFEIYDPSLHYPLLLVLRKR